MKKFLTLLLVCLLVLVPVLTLVSCNDTPDTPETPDDPNTPDEGPEDPDTPDTPTGETIDLVANGASEYRIVYSDFANSTVKGLTSSVRKAIEAVTGVKPDIKTDWEDKDNNADIKEILVGKTNRAESSAMMNELAPNEYGVAVSGNKIVIAGGTDQMLAKAVAYFLSTYCNYKSESEFTKMSSISVPSNLKFVDTSDRSTEIALYVTKDSLTYVDALYKSLQGVAKSVTLKTLDDDVASIFDATTYGTLVIAGADTMPSTAGGALLNYMNNGGRVLLLGGPAFETILYQTKDGWISKDEAYERTLASLTDDQRKIFFDTSSLSNLNKPVRNVKTASIPVTRDLGDYGLKGSTRQFCYTVDSVDGWDNLLFPVGLKGEYNAIGFWVKTNDTNTDSLFFELRDTAGCRWSTAVAATQEWEYKLLYASDFELRNDSKPSETPEVNLGSLSQFCLGFEGNSSSSKSFVLAEPALIHIDQEKQEFPAFFEITLDHVAPMYELYPITNAANIVTEENQVFVSERDYVLPEGLISCHPGRQGVGFDKGTNSRFIPLLRVTDEKGLHSGYAAWLTINSSTTIRNGKLEGSMLGCFSATTNDFYNADGIAAIAETVKAMTRSTFLLDGGTTEHIYIPEDTNTIRAGATFVKLGGADPDELKIEVELYNGTKELMSFSTEDYDPKSIRNYVHTVTANYDFSKGQPDRAVTTMTLGGEVIDRIEQDIRYWSPKPESERKFVYMEDGMFKIDGKPVTFFGVNYMPSYGMAENQADASNQSYFEHYVSNASYDPDVIRYDLEHIKDIGMNAISIFVYYDHMKDCNNILDLITMAEEMGIYVNLSIRPNCYPLQNFNAEETEVLVNRLRFGENDNIVGFDIAWEPRIGNYDGNWSPANNRVGYFIGRQAWDDDWTEWVKTQYGSIAHAKELWGCDISYTSEGNLLVTDAMLDDTSGKYTKMVNAYYRFVDDQVAKEMIDEILLMQSWAPNSLFTFRMSMSGSGYRSGSYMPSTFCFDFQSLASTLAYMEPEGYALSDTPHQALQIPIANAYARYVNPNTPVVWKEFGRHVWDKARTDCNFDQADGLMASSTNYYAYTLEYCLNSYSSGMYCWFYAGGFRIGEDSDYGIINPDGSDRPMTKLLREYAPKFINQGARPEAEVLIEVERDNQLGGVFGIYNATKEEARKAYDEGKYFDFVDANQSEAFEKVYADEVMDAAVGGTKAEGLYPLRYVNGMVKQVNIVEKNGKTYAQIMVCNTKQSTWRAGTVSLISTDTSDIELNHTFDKDVDYLEISGKGALDLRFEIKGVAFGPLYTTTIQ